MIGSSLRATMVTEYRKCAFAFSFNSDGEGLKTATNNIRSIAISPLTHGACAVYDSSDGSHGLCIALKTWMGTLQTPHKVRERVSIVPF